MSIKAKLEALSSQRQDALDQAQALLKQADESGEGLTEEQSAQVDELTSSADTADAAMQELLDRDKAIQAKLEKIQGFEDRSSQIASARGIHTASRPDEGDSRRSKIPATVRRYGELKNFSGVVGDMNPEERAFRFGQYALAKVTMDMPQFAGRFPHARQFAADQFGLPLFAVHGEGASDTSGAHVFVPDEFGMDLIRLRETYGVARQVLRMRTMSSDTRSDPRRTAGLTAYFVGENSAGTESTAAYDSVSLTAKKLMVVTRMSSELNEDSVINLGDELAGEISYAFSDKEDDCAFNGDGTSTYGGILGIRNRLDTLTAGTAPGLILGAGNAWSELTLANLESVVGALPVYADVPGQVSWICHKTFYYTVMVRLALASGGTTSTEVVNGVSRPVFLGYPVRFSQKFPSSEANSQICVTLGNYALGASFLPIVTV